MKTFLSFFLIAGILVIAACNKGTNLPPYTPVVATNFSADSVHHTKDSVNIGDTIYLSATGKMYDTTQPIFVYLTASYTASGVSTVYNYGSAAAPVKINRTIGAGSGGLYGWSSTIALPGATAVPHKTAITVGGNYIYQLNFSSVQGKVSVTDAGSGPKNHAVYVK
jgi:hypothetical protein